MNAGHLVDLYRTNRSLQYPTSSFGFWVERLLTLVREISGRSEKSRGATDLLFFDHSWCVNDQRDGLLVLLGGLVGWFRLSISLVRLIF